MKYLVTVQAKAYVTDDIEVDAATEKEAGLTAVQIMIHTSPHDLVPGSFDVLGSEEKKPVSESEKVPGYISRML